VSDARLIDLLKRANRILVFTGAGVSTGSGIPDYRGPGGIWSQRRPVYFNEFLSSESARVEYWTYKAESWDSAYRDAQPNPLHHAVVALERAGKVIAVVTQNIDGLHRRAGTSPDRLVELHGTDRLVSCLECGATSDPAPHFAVFRATGKAPVCDCGGLLKAATISFGQPLRPSDLQRATRAATAADLVLALGSTLQVFPAASIPLVAADRGAPYVIVNRGVTGHDDHPRVTLRLEGDVSAIVPDAVTAALKI
jgi:NAD-dependent deacetylase